MSAVIGVKESSAGASPLSAAIDWLRGGRGEAKKREDKGGREQRQIKEGEETPEKKGNVSEVKGGGGERGRQRTKSQTERGSDEEGQRGEMKGRGGLDLAGG